MDVRDDPRSMFIESVTFREPDILQLSGGDMDTINALVAQLGLMGVSIAEEYGGSGGDSVHMVIATEEIARACASTSTVFLASVSLACYPIYLFGTEEQKRRFVVPLAKGQKLACFGLTESGAGSDAAAVQTTATLRDGEYVLDGTKTFITNGAEADIAVVFATADKALRHKGIIETVAYPRDEKHVFQRAQEFMRTEGFLPAPESAYGVCCAIDEALKCKETGESKVILFNISGHGFMDIEGYEEVLGTVERTAPARGQSHFLGA